MTRSANAITLRVGYNIFWLHKKSNIFTFFTFTNIFNFFQKEFRKKQIICFKLRLNITKIILIIYKLKTSHIYSNIFYKNITKSNNLYWRLFIYNIKNKHKILPQKINKIITIKKIYKNNHYIYHCIKCTHDFFYLYKKLENWYHQISVYKFLIYINRFSYFLIICFNLKYSTKNIHYNYNPIVLNNLNYNFNLKKIYNKKILHKTKKIWLFRSLNFKFLEIYFENKLFRYFHKSFKLKINSIFKNLIFDFFFSLIKYSQSLISSIIKSSQRKIFFLIYLFFSTHNVELFTRWVGSLLRKTYQHRKKIKYFIQTIYFLFTQNLVNFKGFKIYISGKLNGKMKRSKYGYKMGEIWLNTFNIRINYYYLPLYTKFGVFSLKVWLIM